MGSIYDGLILNDFPADKDKNSYEYNVHLFLQKLLSTLKLIPDGREPIYQKIYTLADDAVKDNSRSGIYIISIGGGSSYAIANAKKASAITLLQDSGDFAALDTDGKYCLIDNTTGIRLKNRIGSAKKFAVTIITTD